MLTAQPGKSLDYAAAAAIIAEKAKPKWVEITVVGEPVRTGDRLTFKASVTREEFLLADDPEAKPGKEPRPFQKLERSLEAEAKITSVTGRVREPESKKGDSPEGKKGDKPPPPTLLVTGFEREDAE